MRHILDKQPLIDSTFPYHVALLAKHSLNLLCFRRPVHIHVRVRFAGALAFAGCPPQVFANKKP
jgi:hypothetical protein